MKFSFLYFVFFFLYTSYIFSIAVLPMPEEALSFSEENSFFLPSASHAGALVEYYVLPGLNANADTNAMSYFSREVLSSYGMSVYWQKYFFESTEITDPAKPGSPLLHFPRSVLTYEFSGAGVFGLEKPGIIFKRSKNLKSGILLEAGGAVEGPSFMPKKTFDREPADAFGAPIERRKNLWQARVGGITLFSGLGNLPAIVAAEITAANRNFVTTSDLENAYRATLFWQQALSSKSSLTFAYEGTRRSQLNAEWGANDNLSLNQNRHAFLWQMESLSFGKFTWSTGMGIAFEKQTENSVNWNSYSLEQKAQSIFPANPQNTNSAFWDLSGGLPLTSILQAKLSFRLQSRLSYFQEKSKLANSTRLVTYGGVGSTIEQYSNNAMSHNWFSLQRAEFPIQKKFAKWEIKWIPAAVFQNGFSSNQLLYSRLNPATKLTFTRKWKKQKKLIFTLAHEVVTIPGNVVRFLNPESLSGEQYSWNDLNGNGIYEASEKGSLLRRFGGAYHKSDDWDTPVYEELAMGYETALSTFWNMIVVADLRWYRNLLKVHADSQTSAGYIKTSYPESRQGYVYDRVSGYGNETYLLGNNQTDSYYASLEINFLRKKRTSFWDTSLGAGAYFQVAAPPPGNGPWINDIGYISEDTADKNAEVASLARTDYDRGYMLHWITNFYFGNITWSHLFRYRDGEPLGDTLIADGLSQGPVVIQDEQRARGYEGISRFTFYLTWDTKLSYTYKNFTFGLEINNIMDSRTELLERYLRDKYFRRPYEMIPPRSLSLSVKWNW